MVTYCKRDVALLEQVYSRLAAIVPPKSHVGVMAGAEKWSCPHCGGRNIEQHKVKVTARGTKQYQMRCIDDGQYYTIGEPAHASYVEWRKKHPRNG